MLSTDMSAMYQARLLDDVRSVKYPSGQILDRIEGALRTTDDAIAYVDALLEKVEDKYPSLDLLDRIDQVIRRVEQAEMQSESRRSLQPG
jgi:hypothetical protein